jgi:hypothetical protein
MNVQFCTLRAGLGGSDHEGRFRCGGGVEGVLPSGGYSRIVRHRCRR